MNARFYVYQANGNHAGPLGAEELAFGIAQGKVRRDAYAGAVGDARWQPILAIAAIAQALERTESRRPSEPPRPAMHSIPPAPPPPPDAPVTDPDITAAFRRDDAKDGAPLPQYPLSSGASPAADDTTRVSAQAPAKPTSTLDAKPQDKDGKKEEPKPTALDPKLRMFVPLGVFGGFAALAFLLFLIGLVASPDPSSSTGGASGTGAIAPHAK